MFPRGARQAPVDWRGSPAWRVRRANLFAYGTLERRSILRRVTGRQFAEREARLVGYRCFRLPGRPYPGIVPCPEAETWGTLYFDVPAEAIDLLDRWEDDFYLRRVVMVWAKGRGTCLAFAYVVPAHRTELITDLPWRRLR